MTINDISGLTTQLANLQHQLHGKATKKHSHQMAQLVDFSIPVATEDTVGGITISEENKREKDDEGNDMPNDFLVMLTECSWGEKNKGKVHIDCATTKLPGIVKSKLTKTNDGDRWDVEVRESDDGYGDKGTMWLKAIYVDESGNNGILKSEDYTKYKELLEEFDKLKLRVESIEDQIEIIQQKQTSIESTLSSLDTRVTALESASGSEEGEETT